MVHMVAKTLWCSLMGWLYLPAQLLLQCDTQNIRSIMLLYSVSTVTFTVYTCVDNAASCGQCVYDNVQEERNRQESLMLKRCLQRPEEQLRKEAEVHSISYCRYSTVLFVCCTVLPPPSLTC